MVAWPATERIPVSRFRPASGVSGVAEPADRERELVDRARDGDRAAFGQLVARYQDVAFRTAYLIARDPDDAADVAQQGFIKAFRGLAGFRTGWPFRPWLLRIVANEARNLRRAAHARERLALRLGPERGAAESPEAQVLAAERRTALLAALEHARPDDQLVIGYRYFFDLSEAEMAVALDCPPGTVKSRLARALGRLRLELAGDPAPEIEAAR